MRVLSWMWGRRVGQQVLVGLAFALLLIGWRALEVGPPFVGNGLGVSSRDGLSICIDAAGGARLKPAEGIEAVRSALVYFSAIPHWNNTGYAKRAPRVVAGCPFQTVMLDWGIRRTGSSIYNVPVRRVWRASEYRLALFVILQHDIDRIFGNSLPRYRIKPEEIACVRPSFLAALSCEGVTLGIYFTPQELSDPEVVREALKQGLGFVSLADLTPGPSPPGIEYRSGASVWWTPTPVTDGATPGTGPDGRAP